MKHVIKRQGHSQDFDPKKLQVSIYATCLAVHVKPAQAQIIAQKVTAAVEKWLVKKTEVTSHDIRQQAGQHLSKLDQHAAYFYLHHRIMW